MKDKQSETLPENLADHFNRRNENLATASNERLRTVIYQLMLSGSKHERTDSDWMLLVAGGALALILPNAKDLLEVYSIRDFKVAVGLLLISGVLGFLAKSSFRNVEKAMSSESDPHAKNIGEALGDYIKKFSDLKDEAAEKGISIEIPAGCFRGMFEPLERLDFKGVRHYVASELEAREKDPHRKWQDPLQSQKRHDWLVFFQGWLLITAFFLLLINLHIAK